MAAFSGSSGLCVASYFLDTSLEGKLLELIFLSEKKRWYYYGGKAHLLLR